MMSTYSTHYINWPNAQCAVKEKRPKDHDMFNTEGRTFCLGAMKTYKTGSPNLRGLQTPNSTNVKGKRPNTSPAAGGFASMQRWEMSSTKATGSDLGFAGVLPDAPARQAWSQPPTYRFFRRSYYDPNLLMISTNPKDPGSMYYRPQSVYSLGKAADRLHRKLQTEPIPRLGEW